MYGWLLSAFLWLYNGIRFLITGFKGWVIIAIVSTLQHLVPKILLALGIGFVTFNLGSYSLDFIYNQITNQFDGVPTDMLAMFKLAKLDEFLSIVFGAYTARLTLAGLGAGSVSIRRFALTSQ